jgi:hypothetical protein
MLLLQLFCSYLVSIPFAAPSESILNAKLMFLIPLIQHYPFFMHQKNYTTISEKKTADLIREMFF